MKFIVYQDARNEWRWQLMAINGKIIANSGEGYKHYNDCVYAINLVKSVNGFTPVVNA